MHYVTSIPHLHCIIMDTPKFLMSNSPLALVVGQVGFSFAPELSKAGEFLRVAFQKLNLPIAEPSEKVHLEHFSPRNPPNLRQETVWLFINPTKTKGVSIGPRHLAFISNQYKDFQDYSDWVGKVVDAVQTAFTDLYFQTIGLRYFNVHKPLDESNDWLVEAVRGIQHSNIETVHFHHRYEFWCETNTGSLHGRCGREHGGLVPKSLEFAERLFPERFLFKKTDHIYHLDIFENNKPLDPQQLLTAANVCNIFNEQHSRIDKVFLNLISQNGLKEFGWTPAT